MDNPDDLGIELIGGSACLPVAEMQAPAPEALNLTDLEEDRYSRLRLIPWWDQELLGRARVMVVGAGALGNEILKNLALLGVGRVFLVDLDNIENSNLSRSVLYRPKDEGRHKAEVAAAAAMEINPDIVVKPFVGNVVHDLGLGVFRAVDVVICGLDNREARLWVNQSCWRVNRPWVDGAIEILNGVVRVFVPPAGSCYECTMNETDYRMLALRKSCALLSRDQMLEGKVPTTPTTSSVIAGVQCQEAIKLLHNRPDLPALVSKGFYFNGLTHDSFVVNYPRKDDCLSHETFEEVTEMPWRSSVTSLGEVLAQARQDLGENAVVDFTRETVCALRCEQCGTTEQVFRLLGKVTEREAKCPTCGEIRSYDSCHSLTGEEPHLDMTLGQIGIPQFDIIVGRSGSTERFYELTGDRKQVLGSIC